MALATVASATVKYGVPVALGAYSFYDRKKRGQGTAQAIVGAGAETAAGFLIPGVGGQAGKLMGLTGATTRLGAIGRSVAGIGATATGTAGVGYVADNLMGQRAPKPIELNKIQSVRLSGSTPAAAPSYGTAAPTAQGQPLSPLNTIKNPTIPLESNEYALTWAGIGTLGILGTVAVTRGRRGTGELAAKLGAGANLTAAGRLATEGIEQVVTGTGKMLAGAGQAASGVRASVAAGSKASGGGVPAIRRAAQSAAVAAGRAIDDIDQNLAKGVIPEAIKPGAVAATAKSAADQAIDSGPVRMLNSVRAATAGAAIGQVNPRLGLQALAGGGRKAAAAAPQAAASAATGAAASGAAASGAKAASQSFAERLGGSFLKNFAPTNFMGEFGKNVATLALMRPVLARMGLGRPIVAAPLAAAGVAVTGATVLNRKLDLEYGTEPEWWDSAFFGGNINRTFGVQGVRRPDRQTKIEIATRKQDAQLEGRRLTAEAVVEAARQRKEAATIMAAARNPALFMMMNGGGAMAGGQGLGMGAQAGQGGGTYAGPAFGPRGQKTSPSSFQAMMFPEQTRGEFALRTEQVRAGVARDTTRMETGAQVAIQRDRGQTQRYQADRTLQGVQARVQGDVAIQKDRGQTQRYQADRTFQGVQVRVQGDVAIQKDRGQTQRYQADRTLQGVQARVQGDVAIQKDRGQTQRYQADRTFQGVQARVQGDVAIQRDRGQTQRYQSDNQVRQTGIRAGADVAIQRDKGQTQRYQSDNQLRGSIYATDGKVRSTAIETAGKVRSTEIETGGRVSIAELDARAKIHQSDNEVINTGIKSRAEVDRTRIQSNAQVLAAQSSAASAIHQAALKADPELATAKNEEIDKIKKRRELQSTFALLGAMSIGGNRAG